MVGKLHLLRYTLPGTNGQVSIEQTTPKKKKKEGKKGPASRQVPGAKPGLRVSSVSSVSSVPQPAGRPGPHLAAARWWCYSMVESRNRRAACTTYITLPDESDLTGLPTESFLVSMVLRYGILNTMDTPKKDRKEGYTNGLIVLLGSFAESPRAALQTTYHEPRGRTTPRGQQTVAGCTQERDHRSRAERRYACLRASITGARVGCKLWRFRQSP